VRRHLVILARRPEHGRVKTRLAAAVGHDRALAVYMRLLSRTLRRLGGDPRWTTVIAATPARPPGLWTRGLPVIAQAEGDIGRRMAAAMAAMPPGPVVLVGSDIPAVGRHHVAAAFRALEDHDIVFGPAEDGGFWLVGLAPAMRGVRLFEGVRWSSEHALRDTLAGLPRDCRTAFSATLADLDDAADLARWRGLRKPV
jgi:rSAM/selenodomain-associated transferase 1